MTGILSANRWAASTRFALTISSNQVRLMSQQTENQPWTIKRLLEWTTNYLGENGSESARLDAEILLAESIGCERIDLYTRFADVPGEESLTRYRSMVKSRADGTPVAYLVGYQGFFSLSFQVNDSVLIPRPETEMLVIKALDLLKERSESDQNAGNAKLIDIGTGSGNIAISIARHWKECEVTAVDISTDALDVARKNAETYQLFDRITFQESNLFEAIEPQTRFDFVVSNPPYIARDDPEVEPGVRNFEPHIALFAGEDGMEVIAPLATDAIQFLNPGGYLLIEISPFIETKCVELLESIDGFHEVQIKNDLSNLPRVAIARKR